MSTNQLNFYKLHGVRNINELTNPRLFDLKQFAFPMKSVLHYATFDSIENGPPSDYILFNDIKKPIYFKPVSDITKYFGSPRNQPVNLQELIRDYRNKNRRMKLLTADVTSVMDPNSLIVFNYCILNKKYKYIRNIFTDYHRWKNIFSTLIETFIQNTTNPQLIHYIPLSIPDVIPSINQLNRANTNLDQTTLKVFNNENSYVLLELWKWLDPNTSSQSIFSTIPLNKLHLLSFIYIKRNKWCVLNLGTLSSYRSLNLSDIPNAEYPVILSKIKLDFKQIQKRLLRLMMTLEAGSVYQDDAVEELEDSNYSPITDDDVFQQGEDQNTSVKTKPVKIENTDIENDKKQQILTIDEEDDPQTVAAKIELQDLELDSDLDQLNYINQRRERELEKEDTSSIYDLLNEKEPEYDKIFLNICDKLADNNLLTAGEYKRFSRLSDSYKRIIARDGKSTLEDYTKIPPEDLRIEDVVNIPDSDAIVDKTMLRSSLEVFDKNYITKDIIGKDTAAMVLSMQKAGVIVADYRVEKHENILGAEEEHTIRVVPIEGVPSTIRFKIPVITQDGSYIANGVRYKNRKQFGD